MKRPTRIAIVWTPEGAVEIELLERFPDEILRGQWVYWANRAIDGTLAINRRRRGRVELVHYVVRREATRDDEVLARDAVTVGAGEGSDVTENAGAGERHGAHGAAKSTAR